MNPISVLKAPATDLAKLNDLRKKINLERDALNKGAITETVFEKRKKDHRTQMAMVGLPLATASTMIVLFGSTAVFETYQAGIPLTDLLGHNLGVFSEIVTNSFQNNPLDGDSVLERLSNMDYAGVKDYVSYVSTGIKDLFKSLSAHFLNSSYLMATAGGYGVASGIVKSLGFVSGTTKNVDEVRMPIHEQTKLNILRKHYHDPVFDSLNNEELFSMSLSFNEVLRANYKGKKGFLRKAINSLDKVDTLVSSARQAMNSSTNSQPHLLANTFKFIESYTPEKASDIDNSLLDYGIDSVEFKAVADKGDGVLDLHKKYDYLFNLNKRAIIESYNRKLQDDMMLAFSLRVESYMNKEVDVSDKDFKNEMKSFCNYVESNSKENNILKAGRLPSELRSMEKIAKSILNSGDRKLSNAIIGSEGKSYITFLEKYAPHLIEKRESKDEEKRVYLNNYSFATYFEASRERLAKLDVAEQRLDENLSALKRNAGLRNLDGYKKNQIKLNEIQETIIDLDDIFVDKNSIINDNKDKNKLENIFQPEVEKISTVFSDKNAGFEITVRNFLLACEEKTLLDGEGLKEKGFIESDAEKVVKFKESSRKKEPEELNKEGFKRKNRRFKR